MYNEELALGEVGKTENSENPGAVGIESEDENPM